MAIIGLSGYSGSGKDAVGKIIQYSLCKNKNGVSLEEAVLDKEKMHDWWLDEQSNWKVKKFASKLKEIASILTGIPIENFEDQEFKKTYLSDEWDVFFRVVKDDKGIPYNTETVSMDVRTFLQKLGTEAIRNGLHDNAWINALFADYVEDEGWVYEVKPIGNSLGGGVEVEVLSTKPEKFNNGYPNWIITDVRFLNEARAIKNKGGIIIRIDRPNITAINSHISETELDNWDFDYKIANVSDLISLKQSVEQILKHAGLYY